MTREIELENEFEVKIGTDEKFMFLAEDNFSSSKLYYFTKDFIGSDKNESNVQLLNSLVKSLLSRHENTKNSSIYLLCSEALNTLNLDNELNSVWKEASEKGVRVYISEDSSEQYLEADDLTAIRKISTSRIAELFSEFNVVTIC